ncbi:MAG: bifunctional 4-hydroxy-2-oxoglutarate aldolase/2-dehydro-3-deoxy-phosphogluconate aldolase [Clostridium sp.]|uniref:bifunctional 4-hydroxy-2-oxoglutarate aldolase/2-dehydro-3-deoxy-phosphogluconate aldolase n=1 Tax=Clostridium sp. TaxID=1506 RepID=UPI0025C186CE|nr:bifunctional 4-hydroxy-2-oxoglutarate aldolase/2-dehydro-3-deoxy-phosphogluconate aldolase [Clostridium sp.]MCF0147329.1 bifunctional 4-hydroxy-2-oxoglutarate aldolase/2-dehydro-3-deoxy-phosphogluconate aldolase [Clostridium sp.]
MFRIRVLNVLKNCGVVAVVRGSTKEIGINISESCIKGNVKAIEVTYTNKFANEIIRELSEKYSNNEEVVIGAGTVLDSETARMAILAGADYIVSPSFNKDTARLCNRYNVPYIPGVMTISEIVTAYENGVDVVKLFPGNAFGQGYISSIKAPLPYANIMVTGGVNLDNIHTWAKAGVDLVGIGGEINKLGETGNFNEIEITCKKYVENFNKARGI